MKIVLYYNIYIVFIIYRISRRLYITDTGKHFLEYASHIVTLFEKMESEIKNWDLIGILRIGSSITVGNYLLPRYIKQFKKQYPNNQIYVKIDNSAVIEQSVLANDIDIGLIEGVVHYPQIVSNRIMYDELGSLHQITINDITLSRELSLLYHKNKYLSKAANEFIKICLS